MTVRSSLPSTDGSGSASSSRIARLRTSGMTAFRSGTSGLVLLALIVGATTALFALGFRWLIQSFTLLLSGHPDYAASPGAAHPWLPGLGPWFVLGTPVIAGLAYGPLVHFFAREARGHGVPEVMFAVARRGGRIKPQVAAVKALASALCIGGGGSVGREGPIVQIGSALGSSLGQLVRLPEQRLRLLVACGAASGIAATFNAPLAGVFFAMELILVDFVAQAFGMVVLAAVTSAVIARAVLGSEQFLTLPVFTVHHVAEYPLFALLGIIGGLTGVAFTRVLYAIEDLCDAVWRGPDWLRPAVGGLALGGLLLLVPQMYGVGYPVLGNAIRGHYVVGFLLLLLVAKMVATSLTIGIGGSGGVFAPSLFIGAMLGSAFGELAHLLLPDVAGPAGAYGLIGMGAVFAGASRAPITAVIILFEMTGQYSIILPLMAAIVLATGISHRISADTIYTLKLRRRGIDLGSRETLEGAATAVRQVMGPVPDPVDARATLAEVSQFLGRSSVGVLPVARDGVYLGVVTIRTVAEALADGRHDATPTELLVELPDRLTVDDDVDHALRILDASGCGALPVTDPARDDVVGWLDYQGALRALTRR